MTLVDAVSLTHDGRRRRTARRFRIAAALLALFLPLPLLLRLDALFALALLGGPILPLLGAYLLISIARGPTSVVVYLRRFGLTQSGLAVSSALESGLSRRHRIVTLDDSRFPPLEVPPWERRAARYGPPLVAALLVLAFVLVVRALRQQGDYILLWLSAGAIPVLAASLWSLLTAFLLFVIHRARIRRQARGHIASDTDLIARSADLVRLGTWWRAPGIAAPQATVLGVDDGIWQRTVDLLVRDCSAVLIDVSEPTENLVWEIQTVLQHAAARAVFVADRQAIVQWSADAHDVLDPELAARIRSLLAGRSVLTYDVSDNRGGRRFRRSLMRALDNVVPWATARRRVEPTMAPPKRFAARAAVVATYLLAPVLASVLSYVAVRVADPQQAVADLFLKTYHPLDRLAPNETELQRRGVSATPGSLARAVHEGEKETAEQLLRAGVPPTSASAEGWTPVLLAARAGNAAMLGTLVAAGANVHDRTDDGRSAVMLAAAGGHLAATQALVEAGADVNSTGASRTPLGLAIQGGHADLVGLLLERGADVSAPHLGMSPLVLAAAVDRPDIIERLLEHGADANARSDTGRTPLGLASIAGCDTCIRALLSKGASVDAIDGFGETALDYAAFNGDSAVAALLQSAGAGPSAPLDHHGDAPSRKSDRSKPHVNLAIVSAVDRQAPALVSAMTRRLARTAPPMRFLPAERLDALRQGALRRSARGSLAPRGTFLEFSTGERHYALCVPASDADFRKASMVDGCSANTVIIVTSPERSDERLDDEVRFLRQAGVLDVVVAIDVEPRPANAHLPEAGDSPIRQILVRHGYGTAPIVRVSSSAAIRGDKAWQASIDQLMQTLDRRPLPLREQDAPLLMVVEGLIERKGRTAIVTVHVQAGTVRPGDPVEIVGLGSSMTTVVEAIETFGRLLDMAVAGDRVGVILRGATAEHARRGQVIATPGAIRAYARFDAVVYLFSPDEGGRLTPVADGYRPFVKLRTADATATFAFPQEVSGLRPGGTAAARVDLLTPLAMWPGLRFTIHEGKSIVGIGIVTRVL